MNLNQVFSTAIYIRLSKEDGDKVESDSIVNQRKLITEYLTAKENFSVYDIYIDDGYTGTNFNRPAFKRMLTDIETGLVNCVIVKDLSRFGRDYIDSGKYLERYFVQNNIRFISITDDIDSFQRAYDIMLPMKNIFNEQYARDISKKVHASMTTKQKAGDFIGAFPSYGYHKSPANKNKLIVDECAASVVRRIFSLYINGYGKVKIARILNDENVPCPSEYKRLHGDNYRNCNRLDKTSYWTYSTINLILKNEMYCGNMVQAKSYRQMHRVLKSRSSDEWIIVENTHEAIIDKDTWQKAQFLLTHRTRNLDLNSNTSIFAGFLKCGDCGRALSKTKRGNDFCYRCGTYARVGANYCTSHTISHHVLEQIVLNDLHSIIASIDNLSEIVEHQAELLLAPKQQSTTEKQRIEAELFKVRNYKKTIYQDYKDELISKEEYLSYRQDYQTKEDLLVSHLEVLQSKPDYSTLDHIYQIPWVKKLMSLRDITELDRSIVLDMIYEINVYENHHIVITYNFSNELETLLDYLPKEQNIG